MAHGHDPNEKIVYVGDSRVRKGPRNNVPADYSSYPGKSEAFIPNFLLKEWMVGAVVLVGYMALVIAHPSPLGYPADPNNTQFIPMPDWYFLFMYQLLKYPYMAGDYVVLGTVGVPGLAFGALLLAPFLDRGKERAWYKRPVATTLMLLSLLAVVYLTNVSWTHYQHELVARGITPEHIVREQELERQKELEESGAIDPKTLDIMAQDDPGYEVFQKATCVSCHGADLQGGITGQSLRGIGMTYSSEEIMDIIQNGKGGMLEQYTANIDAGLTEDEMVQLAEWLAMQKVDEEDSASESDEAASES